ncbi:MAG: hypothetical protein BMS9Abin05_1548 [Rhodothermia bacterium]|nr:MAG: hypothetical protein BMS9Abin05_1548 [Rhodothermia bacterium]
MIAVPAYEISVWLEAPLGGFALPAEQTPETAPAIHASASDAALVDGTLGGNERAFRYLVERYQAHIVRTVTGMLGQSSDVDDTVQEVFVRFHFALASFQGQSSIKTFLTRIAINRSLDVIRSRKRRFLVSWNSEQTENVESELPSPETLAIRTDEMVRLRKAINTLSPRHKAVVVLRLIDGLSTTETADVLQIPYGTVLSRLKRALDRLRETVGESLSNAPE